MLGAALVFKSVKRMWMPLIGGRRVGIVGWSEDTGGADVMHHLDNFHTFDCIFNLPGEPMRCLS